MKKVDNLTPKQERFCKEYVLDFNATEAAIRAGYSKTSAYAIGSANLQRQHVRDKIKEHTKAIGEKYDLTLGAITTQLRRWIWQDVRKYFNDDGTHKNIIDLDDDAAAALAGFEVDELTTMVDGKKVGTGYTKKLKRQDAVKAMEILVKVLGYAAPVKSEVKVSTPLTPDQVKELISSLKENRA